METGWGGDDKFGGKNQAVVQVTFKDSGKERMVSYQFKQNKNKSWKIYDIHYRNQETLQRSQIAGSVVKSLSSKERVDDNYRAKSYCAKRMTKSKRYLGREFLLSN